MTPTRSVTLLRKSSSIICLLLGLLCSPVFANDKAVEQKKLDALKSRIESLQKELKSNTKDHSQQSAALRKTEVAAGKLRKQINDSEQQLKALKKELSTLNKERTELQLSRKAQQKLIIQHINAAYRLGREEHIKLLLNEQEPAEFNRLLKYHDYFLQARADKVKLYLDTIAELNQVESTIATKEQQQLAQRDILKNQQSELLQQMSQRKLALADIGKTISSEKQQLDKLLLEQQALQQVINSLGKTITELALPNNSQPFAERQGKMNWPVKGKLKKRFGNKRKADLRWNGWLLSANSGSQVSAIHHGRVVFANYLRGHGLLLIIDHGDGYMSLYAHNQVLLKATGDWVQAGEQISQVGDSGGLNDSALYFEIRKDSRPRNPSKWLKKS